MTVNKLTLPSKENAVQEKINEIIDNLGGGGTTEIFVATYGTTTYQDVLTAYNAGKFIYAVESTQYMDVLYILMAHNLGPISGLKNFRFINVSGTSNILAELQYDNTWDKTTANLMSNTATGSNSLTILGLATSESASINIGSSSIATRSNSVAIGNSANTISQYSVAIGYNAKAGTSSDSSNGAVAIGYNAGGDYSKGNTVAIGNNAVAKSTGSIAIGNSAEVGNTNYTNGIAIGEGSQVYGANSINLGYGANVTANTLSVGFYGQNSNEPYTLLDGITGLIPEERIGTFSNSINSTAINPLINKLTSADITVAPSADIDTGLLFKDNNNNNIAGFTTTRFTNGTQATSISAINNISGTSKTAYLNVYVDGSGNDYADGSTGVKSTIASWAMPASTSYAVAFDANGYFTASQNGYLMVSVKVNSPSGFYLNSSFNGLNILYTAPYAGWDVNGFIPLVAGQSASIYIVDGYINTGFPKFIPCIGG